MLFRVSKLLVNTAHFRNNLQKDYRHRAASGLRASGSFAKKVSAKPARGIARAAAWIGQGGFDGGGSNGSQQAADLDFSCWIIPLYLGLFMQNGALQRIMNLYLSIVADESKFAEFVHKVADARSGGADHLGKCFLTDVGLIGCGLHSLPKFASSNSSRASRRSMEIE